jgi:prepilin-type N-terminal cleavage/methylation domain-containing protein
MRKDFFIIDFLRNITGKNIFFEKNNQSGFTLVELLVVITIIGVLSSTAYIGFGRIKAGARDDTRISDLAIIKTALSLYYIDNGNDPSNPYPVVGPKILIGDGTIDDQNFSIALAPKYIKVLPKDPSYPQEYYAYRAEKNPGSFNVCAKMEAKSGIACACLDQKVNSGVSYFASCPF